MQDSHVPALGRYYWLVFAAASVFGANMGDCIAQALGWGGVRGLPVIVLALVAIVILERLDHRSQSKAWYWLAIVIIPMAATNLDDFVVGMGLERVWLLAILGVLLVVTYFGGRSEAEHLLVVRLLSRPGTPARPLTDASYWVAMMIASTLGPVASDIFSYGFEMGAFESAGILLVSLFAVIRGSLLFNVSRLVIYWLAVVLVRAAGNAVGDVLAKDPHINLGVLGAALLSGALTMALLMAQAEKNPSGRASLSS